MVTMGAMETRETQGEMDTGVAVEEEVGNILVNKIGKGTPIMEAKDHRIQVGTPSSSTSISSTSVRSSSSSSRRSQT